MVGTILTLYFKLRIDICVVSILLDKFTTRRHVITHQHREYTVSLGCVLDIHLTQDTRFGIHRRLPQLLCIHLTKTSVSLNMDLCFQTPR